MHASYPCKRFHFSGSCYRRDKCIFSHATPPTTQIQKILDRLRAGEWIFYCYFFLQNKHSRIVLFWPIKVMDLKVLKIGSWVRWKNWMCLIFDIILTTHIVVIYIFNYILFANFIDVIRLSVKFWKSKKIIKSQMMSLMLAEICK